jgi:hypothetical protein
MNICRYEMMHGCWAYDPAQRPSFSALVVAIADSLEEDAEYFSFSMSNTPMSPGMAVASEEQYTTFSENPVALARSISSCSEATNN